MKPVVSVIIPTYNRAHILRRAIDSVLAQESISLELIVVDDGSTDETAELMKEYTDRGVSYFVMPQNGGPAKARNYGVSKARGEYIAFHDSDDEWHPTKLRKQLNALEQADGNIGLVYCSFIKKFTDRDVLYPPAEMPMDMKTGTVLDTLLFMPLVGAPTMLVPRAVWEDVQGFREELRCFEDWEFTMRIAARYKVLFVDEVLVTVYQSEDSLVVNSVNAIRGDFYMLKEFYDCYGTDELRQEKLNRISKRVRTREDFDAYCKGLADVMGLET